MSTKGIVIAVVSLVLVAGAAITVGVLISNKKKKSNSDSSTDNKAADKDVAKSGANEAVGTSLTNEETTSNDVATNLGKGSSKKPDGTVVVVLGKNNEYQADFYPNFRFQLYPYKMTKSGQLLKGNYKDGGRSISVDGGATVTSGSVWGNLNSLIRTMPV